MFPKDDDSDWSVNKAFKSVVHGLGDDIRRGTLGTHGNERFEFQVGWLLIGPLYSYCT